MNFRTRWPALAVAGWLALGASGSQAQQTLRIGEINAYKAQPAFLGPYRKGMELAVEEINAAGGVKGRQIELIIRDDNGNPGDTVRAADELLTRERVHLLAGSFLSNGAMALSDFAKQRKVLYIAGEPMTDRLTWQEGNAYTFRLRPGTYTQTAMLIPDAVKAGKKRWAIVYPNYEYGQSAASAFKLLMKQAQPDVEFVTEQAAPLGRVDAGSVAQAIEDAKPDGIFNALFGADLLKFVREGNTRGLFRDRTVISLLSGEPEYLDPMRDEAPNDWIVTGYPWYGIKTPEHDRWVKAYQARFKDYPRLGSVVGYSMIHSIAAAVDKADSTDTSALQAAFRGLEVATPLGKATYRPEDHQATLGAYVGRTRNEGGKGIMVDFVYHDGADPRFQPSLEDIRKSRSKD